MTYFAGAQRTKRQMDKSEREERINRVMDAYLVDARAALDAGFSGLIKAGVSILKDDSEIREICRRIVKHGEVHPFGGECITAGRC